MKTTVKKAFAKVVGAGLLAGALAMALPGAAHAQTGLSIGVRVGQPAYYGYNGYNGYYNNDYRYNSGYDYHHDRWDDRGRHDDHRVWDERHDRDHRDDRYDHRR
jgi:hypothetical protein